MVEEDGRDGCDGSQVQEQHPAAATGESDPGLCIPPTRPPVLTLGLCIHTLLRTAYAHPSTDTRATYTYTLLRRCPVRTQGLYTHTLLRTAYAMPGTDTSTLYAYAATNWLRDVRY
eukprot:1208136-Rhodomonas_salina.1